MSEINIQPKYVKVSSGKRIVILEEEEFDRLLDAIEAAQAQIVLADPKDKEVDWETATKELFRNKIADVRSSRGISQRDLASRLGVKPSTVSRWERKDANLTLETLRKVAAALACDLHDLID